MSELDYFIGAIQMFPKWFTQYKDKPFMMVLTNYEIWRKSYHGAPGISHRAAYNVLTGLLKTVKQ